MNMDYSKAFELLNQDVEKERNKKAEKAVHDNLYNKGFRDGFNQGYDLGFKDGKERAKPLEQEPTAKNNLGVDCVDRRKVICYTCRFCKMDIRDGKPYCSLREKGGKCYDYDSWESQEDVLDKIRAEIEQLPITDTAVRLVTEILEKYKAESEVDFMTFNEYRHTSICP